MIDKSITESSHLSTSVLVMNSFAPLLSAPCWILFSSYLPACILLMDVGLSDNHGYHRVQLYWILMVLLFSLDIELLLYWKSHHHIAAHTLPLFSLASSSTSSCTPLFVCCTAYQTGLLIGYGAHQYLRSIKRKTQEKQPTHRWRCYNKKYERTHRAATAATVSSRRTTTPSVTRYSTSTSSGKPYHAKHLSILGGKYAGHVTLLVFPPSSNNIPYHTLEHYAHTRNDINHDTHEKIETSPTNTVST